MRNEKEIPGYLIGEVWPKKLDQDELLAFHDSTEHPFHIGQSYEKKPARQLKCHKCGGTEFHVGQGDYYTAIRCAKCQWECGIHEG